MRKFVLGSGTTAFVAAAFAVAGCGMAENGKDCKIEKKGDNYSLQYCKVEGCKLLEFEQDKKYGDQNGILFISKESNYLMKFLLKGEEKNENQYQTYVNLGYNKNNPNDSFERVKTIDETLKFVLPLEITSFKEIYEDMDYYGYLYDNITAEPLCNKEYVLHTEFIKQHINSIRNNKFMHGDFHTGNILVDIEKVVPEYFIIDNDDATFSEKEGEALDREFFKNCSGLDGKGELKGYATILLANDWNDFTKAFSNLDLARTYFFECLNRKRNKNKRNYSIFGLKNDISKKAIKNDEILSLLFTEVKDFLMSKKDAKEVHTFLKTNNMVKTEYYDASEVYADTDKQESKDVMNAESDDEFCSLFD